MIKKRILTGAGAWGFGPASTLCMLLPELSNYFTVDFIGDSAALDYVKKNGQLFNSVFQEYSQLDELLYSYDYVISVIEADIMIWAKQKDIPMICIDNIYWLWNWSDEMLEKAEEVCLEDNLTNIRETLCELGEYADYSTMYIYANQVFCQKFNPNKTSTTSRYSNKIQYIDPILYCEKTDMKVKQSNIIVSFSGMTNPYVNISDITTYFEIVNEILKDSISKYENVYSFMYAVPDPYIKVAKKIFTNGEVVFMNHGEFTTALSKSTLLFAPIGTATLFEALYNKIPLITLPEQHDGNFSIYKSVFLSGLERDYSEFRNIFIDCLVGNRLEKAENFTIREFYDFYNNELKQNNSRFLTQCSQKVMTLLDDVNVNKNQVTRSNKQSEVLEPIIGDFKGAIQVTDYVKKQLGIG